MSFQPISSIPATKALFQTQVTMARLAVSLPSLTI